MSSLSSVGSGALPLQEAGPFLPRPFLSSGEMCPWAHICSGLCGASSGYLDTHHCVLLNGMRVGGIASIHYRWNEQKQQY